MPRLPQAFPAETVPAFSFYVEGTAEIHVQHNGAESSLDYLEIAGVDVVAVLAALDVSPSNPYHVSVVIQSGPPQ